jgi:hypothetical protein
MTTSTRSQGIMNQILDNSAAAQDPLPNTSLLATAGVQEFLEGIRRQFQPLDADFAEQIHRELHQELLTLPRSWEDGQQGFMQMALTATTTTYATNARLDLYLMQQSKTTQDPNSRPSPLPKPQPAATTSPQGSGPPPAKADTPPLLPTSATSPEPGAGHKKEGAGLIQLSTATTTGSAATAVLTKVPSPSASPTTNNNTNNNNTNNPFDESNPPPSDAYDALQQTLFDRLSDIHHVQGGSTFSSPAPAPASIPTSTGVRRLVEGVVEDGASDIRDQIHQVLDGFREQLSPQQARHRTLEAAHTEVAADQAFAIASLSHHVEQQLQVGHDAVALLHARLEQPAEQAAQSAEQAAPRGREQSDQVASALAVLASPSPPRAEPTESPTNANTTAASADVADLVAPTPPAVHSRITYPLHPAADSIAALVELVQADPPQMLIPNFVLSQIRDLREQDTLRIRAVGAVQQRAKHAASSAGTFGKPPAICKNLYKTSY